MPLLPYQILLREERNPVRSALRYTCIKARTNPRSAPKFTRPRGEVLETPLMMFEDGVRTDRRGEPIKPLRCATEFAFYDANKGNEMVSMAFFEQLDDRAHAARNIMCSARVIPTCADTEDAAIDEEHANSDAGAQRFQLHDIEGMDIDYATFNSYVRLLPRRLIDHPS